MSDGPNYRWRPATRGDIGSVARFADAQEQIACCWCYGILKDVRKDERLGWRFTCEENADMGGDEHFSFCQIQYDANEEP